MDKMPKKDRDRLTMDMYPTNDGDLDHYAGGGNCICKPTECWIGFTIFRYHNRVHTEQKVIHELREKNKGTINWN